MTSDLGIEGLSDPVEIGRGSFGIVYRAHQEKFERLVAVKVLTQAVLDDASRNRFFRECRAAGKLSGHPNVVTIYDSGFTAHGQPFLSLEYLPAGSLGDRLRANGPFGFEAATRHAIKIAGALESAHRAGLVHRDVKPDNILLDEFNEPKLTDFGIAWMTDATMTSTSGLLGSPAYMAPDVISGQPFTANSDVYALGSTLYSLMSNHPAFVLETDESILQLLARVALEDPPDLRPGLPDPIWQVVAAALSKDPARRPSTALDLARALNAARAQLSLPPVEARVTGATNERGTDAGAASSGEWSTASDGGPIPVRDPSSRSSPGPSSFPSSPTYPTSPTYPPTPTHPPEPTNPVTLASAPPGGGPGGAPGAPAHASRSSRTPLLVGLGVLVVVALVGVAALVATRATDTASPAVPPPTNAPTTATGAIGAGGTVNSEPPTTPSTAARTVDLNAALLRPADIGPNWLEDPGDATSFGGFDWLTPCNEHVDMAAADRERSTVSAGFDSAGRPATSFTAVAAFPDQKSATEFMNRLPALLTCTTWTDASGEVHTAKTEALTRPAGDQSLLFADSIVAGGTTYAHDLAFYRVGRFVGFVTNLTEGGNDRAFSEQLLGLASDKLATVAN